MNRLRPSWWTRYVGAHIRLIKYDDRIGRTTRYRLNHIFARYHADNSTDRWL